MAKFKKGKSGNPAGRPKGIPDRRDKYKALLESHAPDLIAQAVKLAKGGDVAALRLCLERILPPMKAKDMPISLGESLTGTPAKQCGTIIAALSTGRITPDESAALMAVLAAQAKIMAAEELEKRIEVLEAAYVPRKRNEAEHGVEA